MNTSYKLVGFRFWLGVYNPWEFDINSITSEMFFMRLELMNWEDCITFLSLEDFSS